MMVTLNEVPKLSLVTVSKLITLFATVKMKNGNIFGTFSFLELHRKCRCHPKYYFLKICEFPKE